MKIFSKKEKDNPVEDLIREQREKEAAKVWRRGWCMMQATMVCDDRSSKELINMAEEIYRWVYGEELDG